MFDFTDQVVIVTGANGELGRATAEAFAKAGARLGLLGRSLERLKEALPNFKESDRHLFFGGRFDTGSGDSGGHRSGR